MFAKPTLIAAAGMLCLSAFAVSGCKDEPKTRRVTSFEPKSGLSDGGDIVYIKGQGFHTQGVPGVTVYFGDREGKNVRFRGDDTVIVESPPGEPGSEVTITMVFDDSGNIDLPTKFKYVAPGGVLNVDALTGGGKKGAGE